MSMLPTMIEQLVQDRSLDEPGRLRQRIEALDCLETYFQGDLPQNKNAACSLGMELIPRAEETRARLAAINSRIYRAIRQDIRRGAGSESLRQWTTESGPDGRGLYWASGECYDYLDELVSGVLQFAEPDAAIAELAAEMVFYQPTPARHIFDLIERAELTERDVLVDLGSGMGHVPLLTAICSDACSIGIELEAAYVDCAQRSARALNLTRATFIRQDARSADFSIGTVFYLYTPFTGTILRAVLDSLQRQAIDREIRICTFGPCTLIIAKEPWLEATATVESNRIAIFRSGTSHRLDASMRKHRTF
jgi:hypothetical protein